MADSPDAPTLHLIKGNEVVLVAEAVRRVVDDLGAEGFTSVEEFSGPDYTLGEVVMAASTPSMFGGRALVARDTQRFKSADVVELCEWASQPRSDAVVVVVWEKGEGEGRAAPVPKALSAAVAEFGQLHDASPPTGRGRDVWVREQLGQFAVELTPRAVNLVLERIGDDAGRIVGLRRTVEGAFAPGRRIDVDELEPFVGEAGSVPPWDLTDAIDRGDRQAAIVTVQRMVSRGERHPLQVMASLINHFTNIAALSGSGCRDERQAAALLGMKGSTFPAKKALTAADRLGAVNVRTAISLLADADVAMRGGSGLPPEYTLEVLVGRLAALSQRRGRR